MHSTEFLAKGATVLAAYESGIITKETFPVELVGFE